MSNKTKDWYNLSKKEYEKYLKLFKEENPETINMDDYFKSPLWHSLSNSSKFRIVELLIKMKNDINQKDNWDRTILLMYALEYKCNINIIKLMLNNKIDLNQRTIWGNTPLTYALENGYDENIVKLLINK